MEARGPEKDRKHTQTSKSQDKIRLSEERAKTQLSFTFDHDRHWPGKCGLGCELFFSLKKGEILVSLLVNGSPGIPIMIYSPNS